MTVIPAKVAGVKEIIICSPKISNITIVAADIAGADRIFNVGGVQAIGAMAYGTESIPKVDKIVGPGNQYVAAAKKEVYGLVGIDFIAGPSEVLIIADDTGKPDFIAADLLAQAEHDPGSRAEVITFDRKVAEKIILSLDEQLSNLKTKDIAKESIEKNGAIIIVDSMEEAVKIANKRAPEHLELQIKNPETIIPNLNNYGSLFIGGYSAEVFGDYCSGPNHTLPTNGCARYTGGLSVKEYVKVLTFQKVTKEASKDLIKAASKLAEVEGLYAHKNAADIRL
jgi:histidinol dehydrogenase